MKSRVSRLFSARGLRALHLGLSLIHIYGQAGNIGLEGKNFLPHADLKHAFSITGMVYPATSV